MKNKNNIVLITLFIFSLFLFGCNGHDNDKPELTDEDVNKIEMEFSELIDDISDVIPLYEMGEPQNTGVSLVYTMKTPEFINFTHLHTITMIIQNKYDYDISKYWGEINNNSYLMEFTYNRFMIEIIYNDNDKIICLEFSLK